MGVNIWFASIIVSTNYINDTRKEGTMLTIVQLEDGCYRVKLDYEADGVKVCREWTFKPTTSDAPEAERGERFILPIK